MAHRARGRTRDEGGADAVTITGARLWLTGSNAWRYPTLWGYRSWGHVRRHASGGWWPLVTTLAVAIAILVAVPLALKGAVSILERAGVDGLDRAPDVRDWVSLSHVALVFVALVFMRWIGHA